MSEMHLKSRLWRATDDLTIGIDPVEVHLSQASCVVVFAFDVTRCPAPPDETLRHVLATRCRLMADTLRAERCSCPIQALVCGQTDDEPLLRDCLDRLRNDGDWHRGDFLLDQICAPEPTTLQNPLPSSVADRVAELLRPVPATERLADWRKEPPATDQEYALRLRDAAMEPATERRVADALSDLAGLLAPEVATSALPLDSWLESWLTEVNSSAEQVYQERRLELQARQDMAGDREDADE